MARLSVAFTVAAAAGMLASVAAAQLAYPLLPHPPGSRERQAPIDGLKARAPALAKAFAPHVYANAKGERMPYRLFSPVRLEPGRRYPLVVFLHGAGGSGTDNLKQLQGANMFGALMWTLPENQARHPAFVLAPQSDVNWACTIYDPKNPPTTLADIRFCPLSSIGCLRRNGKSEAAHGLAGDRAVRKEPAMSVTYRYHHVGLPTRSRVEGMTRVEHLRISCTDHESNPFGIQWMHYDADCPVPALVRNVAHVAFEVDDLAEALIGKRVIIPPNSPSPGVLVAFIEEAGAPVELLQFLRSAGQTWV